MRAERLIRSCRRLLVVLALVVGPAASAHALELRLGVKGVLTLSGMIGVEPTSLTLPPWYDSKPGVGFGGGVYLDMHFTKVLGMSIEGFIEGNRLFFESLAGETFLEQAVVYEQVRLPLLFRLTGRLGQHAEFTGALGPELLFGLGATPHSALFPAEAFNNFYGADEQFGFALTAALGVGILTKYLHIPIELRFGYNMLGSYSYRDRVRRFVGDQIYVLQAEENFQFAFMIGLGFRIPPETPPKPPKPKAPVIEVDDPFYYPDLPDGTPRPRKPW